MVNVVLPRAVGSQGPAGPMGPGATDQQVASVVTPIVDAKTAGLATATGSNVQAEAFRGAIGSFPTRAAAIASRIGESDVGAIRLDGYSAPGDGGGALYKRVVSEPEHPGKFESADGQWWELAETSINVRMFGAKGDGTTNDLPAILAAQAALPAAGGEIRLRSGLYLVNGSIVLRKGVSLVGLGRDTSRLITETPNINLIDIPSAATSCCVKNLRILNTATNTSGSAIRIAGNETQIEDVRILGGFNGLEFTDDNRACRAVHVDTASMAGDDFVIDGGGNQYLENCTTYDGTGGSAFHVKRTMGFWMSKCIASLRKHGLHVDPYLNETIYDGFITDCDFDASADDGVLFDGRNGKIISVRMQNCRESFSSGHGMRIVGSGVSGLSSSNCGFERNVMHGVLIEGGSDIAIVTAQITGNAATGLAYDGVHVLGGDGIRVLGSKIGPYSGVGNNQRYGVRFTSGFTGTAVIADNDLRGNVTANYLNQSAQRLNVKNNTGYKNEAFGTVRILAGATSGLAPHGMDVVPTNVVSGTPFANFKFSVNVSGTLNVIGAISDPQGGDVDLFWRAEA